MIDIETEKEHDLKNIRQIGSPVEGDRIYIENAAYARIHEEDYAQRRAFIFMGHTECRAGEYTTFVEAAIPVHDLEFVQNVPQWGTHAWSSVFREIKRSYENSIIVGWALDLKGFTPRLTVDLEAVHREQFGGAHQVFLLMDSIEGEEYFYLNKGNRLIRQDGFYVYYSRELHQIYRPEVTVEIPQKTRFQIVPRQENIENEQEHKKVHTIEDKGNGKRAYSYAMTAAIVLLCAIGGVGVAQGRVDVSGIREAITTMGDAWKGSHKAEVLVGTQKEESSQNFQETQQTQETLHLIPIDEIPAGEVKKSTKEETVKREETETAEETRSENNLKKQNDTQVTSESEKTEEHKKVKETETKKEQTAKKTVARTSRHYTVQKGDTLTGISQKLYGSIGKVDEIVKLNQLKNSDDIREGQKLLLP